MFPGEEQSNPDTGDRAQPQKAGGGAGITSPESIELILRAKKGDGEAWSAICDRYYPVWMRKFHGKLGTDLRNVQETQDLVQSALVEAFGAIETLRNDAAFFAWVCTIIRHKLYGSRRRNKPEKLVALEEVAEPGKRDSHLEHELTVEEDYFRLLDAVQSLFLDHPGEMTAVYLKYFENFSIAEMVSALESSERSVHRLLASAKGLLKAQLGGDPLT
jgi:RNA polymerase sigma factor (sigma-70 family)